jgi:hypothetical protein
VLDVDGFRLAIGDNALVLTADAAGADDVVVVQAGQAGFQPFVAQFLDIYLAVSSTNCNTELMNRIGLQL